MKSVKNLLIPFIVMLVLVGVAVVVVITNNKPDPAEQTAAANENVVNIDPFLISSIKVEREDGGIGFQGSVDENNTLNWALLEEYGSDVQLNNSGVTSWVYMLSNFMSSSTVGDSSELDLAEYGLLDPAYTIVITRYDGTTDRIYIGNKTVDGYNCYFMVEGDPNIYTVAAAKIAYCGYEIIDFLESSSFDIDYSSLSTVEFKRLADETDITATCTVYDTGDPVFNVISPYEIGCSPYFTSLIGKIVDLDISAYIDIHEDELQAYGLETPAYEFDFTMNDGRIISIDLSANINGYYYGRCNTIDGYFKISEMQLDYLDTQLMMLLDSYLVYYPASEMSKITGTYGDESFTYDIETTGSISADDAVAELNMRDAKVFTSSGRSYAAILYESLITISVSGIDLEADPEFEPELEFTFITNDYQTSTLSFVRRDDNSYFAFVNGEYSYFYVPATQLFKDAGSDTYNYGAWTAYELANEAIDNAIAGIYDIPADGD